MKKLILMATLAVLGTKAMATTAALANAPVQQGPQGTPKERAERQTKMMTEQLALSADQSTKIQGILLEQTKELTAIREKNQGNREAMMEAARPVREKYNGQIKAVLTAEQFTKYEANAAKIRGGRGIHGGPGAQGGSRRDGGGPGNK